MLFTLPLTRIQTAELNFYQTGPLPVSAPAGSRIAVRAQNSDGGGLSEANRAMDALVHGYY